ncbi:MAG: class I SAM-dependent methyltransferase [Planctomycetaceae bacterium]
MDDVSVVHDIKGHHECCVARARTREASLSVNFIVADVRSPAVLSGQFDFFFDRGCYCAVHLAYAPEYWRAIERATRTGALGLVLMGNAALRLANACSIRTAARTKGV